MGLLLDTSFFVEVLCASMLLLLAFYFSLTKNFKYWEDRGVPQIQPSFPFGNTKDWFLGTKQIGDMYAYFYKQFKDEPYFGVYEMSKPVFVVRDPKLVKHILIKDFNNFQDRFNIDQIINPKIDYIVRHLFNLGGQEWKNMRVKLSPTFTSGKMKNMFLLMEKCGEQLVDHVRKHTEHDMVIDVKDILARFTLDIIATCAFGLETNSLKNQDCEFYNHGLMIFNLSPNRNIRRILTGLLPNIIKKINFRLVSKDLTDFFTKIVRDTVEYRKKNNVNRNDFLNLLIQLRQNKTLSDNENMNGNLPQDQTKVNNIAGLTIEEMTAQVFVFFVAGFETASSTMSFCLYELAQHPDIQDALYQEITKTLENHGGKPTYQALQEMPYMDKVINETLRRYASLPVLNRKCTETYKVPDSNLVLEKGISVVIPLFAIHNDPRFYNEPFKFDPERFSPERVKERDPYVHLPFGEGPRMCIGMRFGILQTKIGLTHMLLNFEFGLTPKTQIPASLNKSSFVTQPDKPILLNLTRRSSKI